MARYEMNQEYFSGSQASIFIGDVWVDEIVDWQCSVGANATPIYGYGDTFWSHAAQGRVIVQGNFTINFKEPNYLFAILERYKKFNQLNVGSRTLRYKEIRDRQNEELEDGEENTNPYAAPDNFRELNYVDKRKALSEFFDKPIAKPGFDSSQADNPAYVREIASMSEDIYQKNSLAQRQFNKNFGGNTLGNLDPRLTNDFAIPLFDIKIGYGTTFDEDTIGEQLVGVKLVGKGRTIMANGEPIKETYSFFAKNLV